MKNKRTDTITNIVECIAIYDPGAPKTTIREHVDRLDPESIGVLHGICGVFRHAIAAKMPAKWIAHIHSDLLEAFQCLSSIAEASDDDRN